MKPEEQCVVVGVYVKLDIGKLSTFSPDRVKAMTDGLALVISASSPNPKGNTTNAACLAK